VEKRKTSPRSSRGEVQQNGATATTNTNTALVSRQQHDPQGFPRPTPTTVYNGPVAIGQVEDHGTGCIWAFNLMPEGRVRIGVYPDRRAARLAVERLHGLAGDDDGRQGAASS